MCGRFVQTQEAENYGAYFSVDIIKTDEVLKSWNVAPTKQVYAVAEHEGELEIELEEAFFETLALGHGL